MFKALYNKEYYERNKERILKRKKERMNGISAERKTYTRIYTRGDFINSQSNK